MSTLLAGASLLSTAPKPKRRSKKKAAPTIPENTQELIRSVIDTLLGQMDGIPSMSTGTAIQALRDIGVSITVDGLKKVIHTKPVEGMTGTKYYVFQNQVFWRTA